MKILVLSDSHGGAKYIRGAIEAHPDADMAIFLGDGAGDAYDVLSDFPRLDRTVFRGNCDSALTLAARGVNPPEEGLLDLGGKRFFCLHGHTRGAKSGYGRMLLRASETGADAVLFGHTHMIENSYERDPARLSRQILFFNPGSVGLSYTHPYGVICVENGVISASLEHAKV